MWIKLVKINIMEQNTLDKCIDCKMAFNSGQEYWYLKKQDQELMRYCVHCWNNYSFAKKTYEK